jgi:SAM-dependent methyltransferase
VGGEGTDGDVPPGWPRSATVAEVCAGLLRDHRLGRLLDAGGGTGLLTAYLLRGREVDSATVLDARASVLADVPAPILTRHSHLEELDDTDGEFGTILLRQVLHYVPSPDVALRRLRHRLAPEGALYVGQIVAPDQDCARWLGRAASWISPTRHRVWTADRLFATFERAGLALRGVATRPHWQALDRCDPRQLENPRWRAPAAMPVQVRRGTVCCRLFWVHALLTPGPPERQGQPDRS